MASLKHYPDKPWEVGPDRLSQLDNGEYICQQKCDGWRMEVCKTIKGEITYISRHNKSMDNDVQPHIQEQMALLMSDWPNACQLDGEWLSRRESTNKTDKPHLVLFDLIRYNRRWKLGVPYIERWEQLQKLFAEALQKYGRDAFPDISLAVTARDGEFVQFYESQKQLNHSEGVVIKAKNSILVGDRKESKKNLQWMKIKYRGMSDGLGTLDHLR